jgi:hypothetical protein
MTYEQPSNKPVPAANNERKQHNFTVKKDSIINLENDGTAHQIEYQPERRH